jgi:glycosyltransferase involved in cell wall biosynthesis
MSNPPLVAVNGMLLRRPYSGVETSILQLAAALARFGSARYAFHVPSDFEAAQLPAGRMDLRPCPRLTPSRTQRILYEQFALPEAIAREGAALLHAPGYIAPLRCGVPVVLTVYDVIALRRPGLCTLSNRLHYRLMLPLSLRRAARIVVPSDATRRDVVRMLPHCSPRVRVVPLGVRDEFHAPPDPARRAAVRGTYALPAKFILFVGKLEPKKNLVRLVEVFHALRAAGDIDHKLVLAGPRGWGGETLDARIRALGLGGEVVTPGFIADADLPAVYELADLFVFPSLYEGFGIPPLEAMARGVPVACSDRGALPETVGSAAAIFDPDDGAAMGRALRELLTNPARRRECIALGHARAAQFTWRRHAETVDALYREVLAEAGRV